MKTIEKIAQKTVEKFVKDRISKITTYEEKMQILNLEKLCINAINEAQQWISIEDELPEENKRILLKNDSCEYVGFFSNGDFFASTFFILGRNEKIKEITHWRPINLK